VLRRLFSHRNVAILGLLAWLLWILIAPDLDPVPSYWDPRP
jgi:hypothetical protein